MKSFLSDHLEHYSDKGSRPKHFGNSWDMKTEIKNWVIINRKELNIAPELAKQIRPEKTRLKHPSKGQLSSQTTK